jgi:hypothetical protein
MIINGRRAVDGMRIDRGNGCTERKPTPVSLCPPKLGRRGGKLVTTAFKNFLYDYVIMMLVV